MKSSMALISMAGFVLNMGLAIAAEGPTPAEPRKDRDREVEIDCSFFGQAKGYTHCVARATICEEKHRNGTGDSEDLLEDTLNRRDRCDDRDNQLAVACDNTLIYNYGVAVASGHREILLQGLTSPAYPTPPSILLLKDGRSRRHSADAILTVGGAQLSGSCTIRDDKDWDN